MRTYLAFAVTLVLALPALARAECTASSGGTYSYDLRVSPRAGMRCLIVVDVHAGPSCEGEPEWSVERSCGQTRRMVITDRARLVSVLAPRASRRAWNIVLVTTRARPDVWLRLEDLPGIDALHGTVRMTIEPSALVMRARDGEARVALADIEVLADRAL